MSASITIWERIEPRPRANDPSPNFAAPIRDPLWFLARQWQMGEFEGRDAGSLAYVDYYGSSSQLPRYIINGVVSNVDANTPLEKQTLSEPIEPDTALQVELGQLFADLLAQQVTDPTALSQLLAAFLQAYPLGNVTSTDQLNPVDPQTQKFLSVCLQRATDGYKIFQLGQTVVGGAPVPSTITTTAAPQVKAALTALVTQVTTVFGALGSSDPAAWTADRLEYDLQVVAVDPAGQGNATLQATPNSHGEFDWYSFDVVSKNPTASETAPVALQMTTIPSAARFPGMPGPRYWYIEENTLPYVNVQPDPTDIVKLLVRDMMFIYGADWFLLPFPQDVGTAVLTKGLVVTDTFGHRNLVSAANQPSQPASLDRWAMFAVTDNATGQQQLTNYFVVPQSPGPLAQDGAVLEDVRFGQDETASMAWAIERVTESPIGEAFNGRERDGLVTAAQNLPPAPPGDPSAVLKYQIENIVPVNWFPLLGVQPNSSDPSIQLEESAMLRPIVTTPTGGGAPTLSVGVAPPLGRFLNPSSVPSTSPYRIVFEEVPRDGVQLTRAISRARWLNGSAHLWVSRRRVLGAGEAQSGLRFDSALPNQT